jgi:hypothetical protein
MNPVELSNKQKWAIVLGAPIAEFALLDEHESVIAPAVSLAYAGMGALGAMALGKKPLSGAAATTAAVAAFIAVQKIRSKL